MSGKNMNFNNNEIRKSYFYKNKKIYNKKKIDTNKILVSKKESYCTKSSLKFFIGYNDNNVISPLCIRLLQMIGYVKKFDENVTMSFGVKNKQLPKNYNKIWEKVENLMKKKFESKPVYDNEYIKTKIKIYANSIITNFHNKEIPKEKAQCECLSIIMLDSVIKANKNYYPQTLLEECKHEQKTYFILILNYIENYINEDLEISESDNDFKYETDNDSNDDE